MEEHHSDEHSSFIKTPKQLVVVIVLAFIVPIGLISMIASLAMRGVEHNASATSEEAVAKRLKPVGQVVVAEGSDVKGQRTGKQVVESVCSACHATGALNAPKIGDKALWGPLIKEGHEHLTENAIKGVRQMPPRGGNPELTDAEIARAVAFMANQAGANFTEPPVQAVAATQVAAASSAPIGTAAAASPAPAAPSSGSANGKTVFDQTCAVCHATGVAGAPKAGDKQA